ncbi:MAG: dCTP deaminase [Burkholderiaceae bacterium]
MIINGNALRAAAPLHPMLGDKQTAHGVSHGLSEAGYDVRIKQEVLLTPEHRFTLASTLERFNMPNTLVGVVHDKSTWARQGLSVLNTVIEPGWRGWLTLELVYHGNEPLVIPAGAGIAQVLFYKLAQKAHYAAGKYQDQPDHPVAAQLNLPETDHD